MRDNPHRLIVFEDPRKPGSFIAIYRSSIYGCLSSRAGDIALATNHVIYQRKEAEKS